jgi:glycosyltransferase involved in cell wall biosynthesis
MRIASVIRPESVNANYRARIPLLALTEQGHEYVLANAHDIPNVGAFAGYDVVHFCRIWEEPFQQLARALRDRGIGVTWDCDDDLAAIEKETSSYRVVGGFNARRVVANMVAMMRLAHVVTTPCHVLEERFRRYAQDVRLIENYLAPPMIVTARPRRINQNLRIGWIAGNEHRADVERLKLKALFERILSFHPSVEFISVGVGLGIKRANYHHIPSVDLLELPQVAAQFDVGIAPLADTRFNRARSNIKVKEYAAAGTPWLASDMEPYQDLGEAHGGLVISNDQWERAVMALLGDPTRRNVLARRARAWGKTQGIMSHTDGWEQAFVDAANRARRSEPTRPEHQLGARP